MRAGRRSVALALLASFPLACTVYDSGALPIQNDDTSIAGGGATSSGGSSPGTSLAGINNAAGADKATGGSGGIGNTAGTAGHAEAAGGTDEGAGGDAQVAGGGSASGGGNGGAASQAGSGGKAGNGGANASGGTGGKASGGAGGVSPGGGAPGGGTPSAGGNAGGGSGGNGGSGGSVTPPGPLCSDHPLTARAMWIASASISNTAAGDTPPNLLDNKITRWTTGKPQSGDEWLQIDFGAVVTLNHVNLQQGTDTNDYPRGYAVIVSDTAKDLTGTIRVSGSGKSGVSSAILLPALASGRFLLIKQTGSSLAWWSAEEIEVSCAD